MIGPGGLLLVIPTYLQYPFEFDGWGLHKKLETSLSVENRWCRVCRVFMDRTFLDLYYVLGACFEVDFGGPCTRYILILAAAAPPPPFILIVFRRNKIIFLKPEKNDFDTC
jgi:hypothetical protein